MVAALTGPTDFDPLVASAPLQPLEPVHDVALEELHVSVELAPFDTDAGLADNVTAGDGDLTVTVAVCDAVPPAPLQLKVKLALDVSAPELCEPLVAFAPLHAPDAVQPAASADDHVSVVLAPLTIVEGEALKVTVGAREFEPPLTVTVADWLAVPPAPVQLNV